MINIHESTSPCISATQRVSSFIHVFLFFLIADNTRQQVYPATTTTIIQTIRPEREREKNDWISRNKFIRSVFVVLENIHQTVEHLELYA